MYPCADQESFFRGGPTLTTVFLVCFLCVFFCWFFFFFVLVDEGREDPNTTTNGPSSARQPAKCRFAGGPMVAQH